jgi:tetratricopeptide (TPR) repeat protein
LFYRILLPAIVLVIPLACLKNAPQRRPLHSTSQPVLPECVSLLGRPLVAQPAGADIAKLEAELVAARADTAAHPDDPARIVWVGRRLAYLWRYREAIDVFTAGIKVHPDYAPLHRHRGHRYITLRQFDRAIEDLQTAARLVQGQPEEVELDGMPNAKNIPLTTTAFNVYYHLGVAHYLRGDFNEAVVSFRVAGSHGRGYDDNLVAVTDWKYMCLRRLGRDREAAALLEPIKPDMEIIENKAYHRRLLMYQGLLRPEDLFNPTGATPLDIATQGYGVGNWHLYNGRKAESIEVFTKVVDGPYWSAFGYIAAEVELTRMGGPVGLTTPSLPLKKRLGHELRGTATWWSYFAMIGRPCRDLCDLLTGGNPKRLAHNHCGNCSDSIDGA